MRILVRRFLATSSRSKDPWAVLGCSRGSSPDEVRKAYLKLAKKFHPDTSAEPNAKDRFVEVQSAYEALSNPEKKEQFEAGSQSDSPHHQSSTFHSRAGSASDFSNIFRDIFEDFSFTTGNGPAAATAPDPDVVANISLSFEEAALGAKRTVSYLRQQPCSRCNGTGTRPRTGQSSCRSCHGTGQQKIRMQGFLFAQSCGSCAGTGTSQAKCDTCDGGGYLQQQAESAVNFSAGLATGDTVKHSGAGNTVVTESGQQRTGSLYLRVQVAKSSKFERKGNDIYSALTVPVQTAIFGGTESVETLNGACTVSIPSGSQPGQRLCIPNQGIKNQATGATGSHYVLLQVAIPSLKDLTPEQKNLFSSLFHVSKAEGKKL